MLLLSSLKNLNPRSPLNAGPSSLILAPTRLIRSFPMSAPPSLSLFTPPIVSCLLYFPRRLSDVSPLLLSISWPFTLLSLSLLTLSFSLSHQAPSISLLARAFLRISTHLCEEVSLFPCFFFKSQLLDETKPHSLDCRVVRNADFYWLWELLKENKMFSHFL